MIRLTKDALREIGIHNPWMVARACGNKVFVSYEPATTGLAAIHARWQVNGIGIKTSDSAHWAAGYNEFFTVTCRENKQTVLEEVIAWVKEHYSLDCTDKDPFGAYHPKGTLDKIMAIRGKKLGI